MNTAQKEKPPVFRGFRGTVAIFWFYVLVEPGGVEPPTS